MHEVTCEIAEYAASHAPAQEVPHALGELAVAARELSQIGLFPLGGLGLLASRQRVSGFADAQLDHVDTENFDEIEDELFRWARTVEGNLELRRLLLDRDAPLASRLGTVEALLGGKVDAVTLALAMFVIEGGRSRDVVGTLDYLVDYVAKARDWRVARVHTARPLDDQSRADLVASLSRAHRQERRTPDRRQPRAARRGPGRDRRPAPRRDDARAPRRVARRRLARPPVRIVFESK